MTKKLSYKTILLSLALTLSFGPSLSSTAADFITTQTMAAQGDADSQYRLGFKYYTGKGVKQDYSEAFRWYLKAANQGHFEAQNNLGAQYDKGKGVKQHSAEASRWYHKAAERDGENGKFNVGAM